MIGERLSDLRIEKGMTQEDLAKLLSVSKYTISSYENGHTSPDDQNLVRLAQIFDVSLDYLLGLIDEPLSYDRKREADKPVIRIPAGFCQAQIDEVEGYMEFIKYREARKKRKKREKKTDCRKDC